MNGCSGGVFTGGSNIPHLAITIVRFVDDHQPGLVECEFADAEGRIHKIVEKIPLVTAADLWRDSTYPQPGSVACEVLRKWSDEHGRELARITTDRPWSIESTEGLSEFVMLSSQLSD